MGRRDPRRCGGFVVGDYHPHFSPPHHTTIVMAELLRDFARANGLPDDIEVMWVPGAQTIVWKRAGVELTKEIVEGDGFIQGVLAFPPLDKKSN